MSIATVSVPEPAAPNPFAMRFGIALACAALADWLLIDLPISTWNWSSSDWQIGLSLAMLLGTFGVVAVTCNRISATRPVRIVMIAVFAAGLLALIEDVDLLSAVVGTLATAMFVIVMTARENTDRSWQRQLFEAATIPFRGPFRLIGDVIGTLRHITPGWVGWAVGWIVPLGVFTIFLVLLASANPLIERQLVQIDLRSLMELLFSDRSAFWIAALCLLWPLIDRRLTPGPAVLPPPLPAATPQPSELDFLLGERAMSRSLILFNALFALQSGLDLTYLWGGASLPDGMSFAEYSHRGAYPLIATALLAAGFVLVAMRPGGPAEQSRLIRPLVLAWTGQNVLLVISSIFRLDLYVAAYSLTYLRLAAFIWMSLVATGLVLMLIQIVRRKPNSWLVNANAISLALVLYACCFINTPRLVASYNVEHSREIAGAGPTLDLKYLASLGPQAEPALRPHLKEVPALQAVITLCRARDNYLRTHSNWRGWSFRTWRLERYLANNPETSVTTSDSDKG